MLPSWAYYLFLVSGMPDINKLRRTTQENGSFVKHFSVVKIGSAF